MLPEQQQQQQRIMGYFIEEAKDHLNTIEQGLLSLQATIEDSEKANELFRAAHSVKGGAAMLGLESIQHTAHRMEDYFKVLKESPVKVDRVLETMFLRVSDGLKDLLEQLEGPFGLTADKAQEIMADVEPVFAQLEAHLNDLVEQSGGTPIGNELGNATADTFSPEAVQTRFKRDVAGLLREMLATFKQPDNEETRKKIQDICAQFIGIGEQFELAAWCDLIETARLAADSSDNDYRTLAPVLIKEIKKAQDLVLSGRASEVSVCEALQALLPDDILATESDDLSDLNLDHELADSLSDLDLTSAASESASLTDSITEPSAEADELEGLFADDLDSLESDSAESLEAEADFAGLFGDELETSELEPEEDTSSQFVLDNSTVDAVAEASASNLTAADNSSADGLFDSPIDEADRLEEPIGRLSVDLDFGEIPSELSMLNRDTESEEKADESLDALLATVNVTGPDVGTEELNSLADLFDGDLDELDNTLGGHAFISEEMQLNPEKIDQAPEDDLQDLLAEAAVTETISAAETDDEMDDDLFGGTLNDGEFAVPIDDSQAEAEPRELPPQMPTHESSSTERVDDSSELSSELSEDPWADDDALFGVENDELKFSPSEADHSKAESPNTASPNTDISELDVLGLDSPALEVPELDIAGLDDSLIESTIAELDLDELSLDAHDELSSGIQEEKSTDAGQSLQSSSHTVSPRELDIEFPTLTGVKLQKAEQAIDSFFLDDETEENVVNDDALDESLTLGESDDTGRADNELSEALAESEASEAFESETFEVGEQLADDPWGELPIEATLTGTKGDNDATTSTDDSTHETTDDELADLNWADSSTDDENTDDIDLESVFLEATPSEANVDVEQAGSELDELLDASVENGIISEAPVANTDDLWNDLVSPSQAVNGDSEGNAESVDLESGLLDEGAFADSTVETDAVEGESSTTAADEWFEGDDLFGNLSEEQDPPEEEDLNDRDDFEIELRSEETSIEPEIEVSNSDIVDETADDFSTLHQDVSGDELSDEILADFATAFGIETASDDLLDEISAAETSAKQDESDDLWNEQDSEVSREEGADSVAINSGFEETPTLDGIANSPMDEMTEASPNVVDSANDLEINDLEIGDLDASDLDTGASDLSVGELNINGLGIDELDLDGLLEIDDVSTDAAADEGIDSASTAAEGVIPESAEEGSEADNFFESEAFSLDIDGSSDSDLESSSDIDDDLSSELDGFLTGDELEALEADDLLQDLQPPGEQSGNGDTVETSSFFDTNGGAEDSDFDDLDSLLAEDFAEEATGSVGTLPTFVGTENTGEEFSAVNEDEDFGDLERLLEDGPSAATPAPQKKAPQRVARRSSGGSGGLRDQNMRVSVSHLDTLSNLVGELVVSRNTLERDQERLRQFLDNLLFQVQQLNDVGQRMRDLYERSLLESSLMSSRIAHSAQNNEPADPTAVEDHATGEIFDALEMDRFTGFHTLSQEMIELIVRVRESSSDIGYTVESSDQVTRQFRQITTQLQEGLNTARMVAFSQAADRLPRAVRDISLKCGKEARLVVEGQDTLIDKMLVEHLYDPLTHLVNNAITHGIETPETRKAVGKLTEGTITVRAFYQGNQTVLYVADDGGGIDTEFVKRKAIEKNLITQAEAQGLSDIETYDLLFHPGFSTRDQADDFAGRGVGMDVVRTSLAEIRGSVTIDSELGKGTSFTIRLPLTLSISKALSCVSNQARIAFPMDGVEDMLDVPRDRIVKNDQGQDCVRWRDKLLTFQPVTELLKFNRTLGRGRVYGGGQNDDVLSIIVLRSANTYIAVQVDQVIGEQEIVIKQLEGPVPKPLGIAGATILGDGRVMPIADVLELIDIATGRVRRESSSMLWAQDAAPVTEESSSKHDPTVLIVDDSITVRELLSMSFNKVGYRVEQARDGQEAWDKLRSGLPCDLVFCDIEMPRMDGLELLSRMQKDNHLKSIPIAMLTSRGADRHRQMAVDLGASGYFTKPYLEEALLDAAQRMLNGETLAKGRGG